MNSITFCFISFTLNVVIYFVLCFLHCIYQGLHLFILVIYLNHFWISTVLEPCNKIIKKNQFMSIFYTSKLIWFIICFTLNFQYHLKLHHTFYNVKGICWVLLCVWKFYGRVYFSINITQQIVSKLYVILKQYEKIQFTETVTNLSSGSSGQALGSTNSDFEWMKKKCSSHRFFFKF